MIVSLCNLPWYVLVLKKHQQSRIERAYVWKVFPINIVYHKNYHYEIYEILGERVVA